MIQCIKTHPSFKDSDHLSRKVIDEIDSVQRILVQAESGINTVKSQMFVQEQRARQSSMSQMLEQLEAENEAQRFYLS